MTDRELSEAVARKLGWKETTTVAPYNGTIQERQAWTIDGDSVVLQLPPYSTDIKAAWEIGEKHKIIVFGEFTPSFTLRFDGKWHAGWGLYADDLSYESEAETAPRAIALAFLKLK